MGSTEVTSAAYPEERPRPEDAPLLVRRIEAELASHPELSGAARNVEVSVTEGIATFRGAVADSRTKGALDDVARDVPGVVDTLNKVEVSPTRAADQAEIDDRIAFSLQRSLMFHPSVAGHAERVTIDVTNGRVTLRGKAADGAAREAVQRIAEGTPGVTTVTDRLTVGGG